MNPDQKQSLKSWAEQRDTLLREIGILQTEKNDLDILNKQAGIDFSDLEKSIANARGRFSVIGEIEEKIRTSLPLDIEKLELEKITLQSTVLFLKDSVDSLSLQKSKVIEDLNILLSVYEQANSRVETINEVIEKISKIGTDNKVIVEDLMKTVKSTSKEVIDINQKNVKEASSILEKLPAMLVELQKQNLIKHRI